MTLISKIARPEDFATTPILLRPLAWLSLSGKPQHRLHGRHQGRLRHSITLCSGRQRRLLGGLPWYVTASGGELGLD